jgi:uncharacterized protein (DUF2384 family)
MLRDNVQRIGPVHGASNSGDWSDAFRIQSELEKSRDAHKGDAEAQPGSFGLPQDPQGFSQWVINISQPFPVAAQWRPPTQLLREFFTLGLVPGHAAVRLDLGAEPQRLPGPLQFINSLVRLWNLDEQAAARLLGFEPQDMPYAASVLSGRTPLIGKDAKARVANLARIRSLLDGLFRDVRVENEWLATPKRELGDRSPRSLLDDGSLESLLTLRHFIERASGI